MRAFVDNRNGDKNNGKYISNRTRGKRRRRGGERAKKRGKRNMQRTKKILTEKRRIVKENCREVYKVTKRYRERRKNKSQFATRIKLTLSNFRFCIQCRTFMPRNSIQLFTGILADPNVPGNPWFKDSPKF